MISNSNSTIEEQTSPFYKKNKAFCFEIEGYLESKNGTSKGEYNAWAYIVYGKITKPTNWVFKYRKSTYTTSGNLFIPAEKQGLLVLVEWKTKITAISNSNFFIRSKRTSDFINPKISTFENHLNYSINNTENKPLFFTNLIRILSPLFIEKKIYKIEFQNNELRIELRSKGHHFEILDNLIEQIK